MASFSLVPLLGVIFCLFATTPIQADECPSKVVFCYYSSWALYRPSFGAYKIEDIEPKLCTHLIYAFAGLNLEGLTFSMDPDNDLPELGGNQQYYHFRMLKEKNPCLKVLLSIGGWEEGSEKYSLMAHSEESRHKFVYHLIRYIVYYGFDGIDLDWEYPGARGGISEDRQNFVELLKKLSEHFHPRHKIVSIAVGAATEHLSKGYDAANINKYVDFVLMMTYDYHKFDVTSHVAPLRLAGDEESVSRSVDAWIGAGLDPKKLVLGILTSGRTFILKNEEHNGLGSEIDSPGAAGPFTGIPGFISYYEVCDAMIEEPGWETIHDDDSATVYATKGKQWVTYEDVKTTGLKVKYALEKGLAGVMVYSTDTDDFRGFCGPINELQHTVMDILNPKPE